MQTEDDFGKSTMLNSPSNIVKKLPNEDVEDENTQRSVILTAKKEPRDSDRLSFCTAKKEPREDDQSTLDHSSNITKPKGVPNDDKGEDSLNGVLDITETSSDEENTESSDDTKDRVRNSLKKEEFNEVKMLDDQDNSLNDDDDLSYTNGSNDQFPFNLDNNDQLSNDFLEDEGVDNPLGESEGGDADDGTDDPNEDLDADNTGEADEDEDSALRETDENNDCDINLQINDESASGLNDTADKENLADEQSGSVEKNTSSENEPAESTVDKSATSEDTEKEPEPETHDNKRPASRESTTSTTSNSSERLIIRSATDLNKLVVSVADAFIKKEKISQDQSEEQAKEKPHGGLSVVNPSQLGVSPSGGENLLQNVNFAQPNDQMNVINYVGCSAVAAQCDVCEVQFPDNIMLADHRASAGHYKCALNADCAALVFSSMTELSAHQQSAHGVMPQSPVQQLAHQVQSLPIPYQMDQQMNSNYRTMQQYPPQSSQAPVRSMMPQVYPGQQNNVQQIRGYSIANQPRLHIGSVRGNVPPMAQPPNLKRPAVPPPQPRITPTKRSRTDYMRNGDTDCKVVSVQKPDNTDDVVAQLSKSITITARQDTRKKNDTAAVTNMLANRGITVSSVPAKQNQNNSAVQMLNLNSAVSLIPTNNANNRQGRANGRQMAPANPSRLQTVDLTGPDTHQSRNLQMISQTRKTSRFQCQICDRMFATPEQLNQHMITHGNVNRNKQMAYKCNQCTAQYPNQQQLQQHKQTYHRESVAGTNEMVIPVVNLKQPGTMQKLSAIGVHHIIPLNALGTQSANGTFGIPILPLSSDRNQQLNMSSCGITNILPIGPLKTLGRM